MVVNNILIKYLWLWLIVYFEYVIENKLVYSYFKKLKNKII